MKKDITKLPKWSQQILSTKSERIAELEKKVDTMERMLSMQDDCSYEWTYIGNFTPEERKIFFLDKGGSTCIGTIGGGKVMFLGKKRELK